MASTGQTVAIAFAGAIGLIAVIALASNAGDARMPKPGERALSYRGKPFFIYPAKGGTWELDIGDELHVMNSEGQYFTSSAQAAKFAHKRIDSSDPPRFY